MLEDELLVETVHHRELMSSIRPEELNLDASRFTWTASLVDNGVLFKISARDKVAMRAARSSVNRLVSVFDKISGI